MMISETEGRMGRIPDLLTSSVKIANPDYETLDGGHIGNAACPGSKPDFTDLIGHERRRHAW